MLTNNKYYLILLIALFPIFSLDVGDKLGFEKMDDFSASKLFRMGHFFLLFGLFFLSKSIEKIALIKRQPQIMVYLIIMLVSIGVKTPMSIVAWYRYCEIVVILSLIIVAIYNLLASPEYDAEDISRLFLNIVFLIGLTQVIVVFAYLIIKPSMVWVVEVQGRHRLGGYVYSPNMLAIMIAVSNYALLLLNTMRRDIRLPGIILFHLVVIFTDSRTGIGIMLLLDMLYVYQMFMMRLTRRSQIFVIILLFYLAVIIVVVGYLMMSTIMNNLAQSLGNGKDPLDDLMTLNSRTEIFDVALQGARENYIIGVGNVVGVSHYLAENFTQPYFLPPHTHNIFVESLLANGWVLGSLVCGFYIYCFMKAAVIVIRADFKHYAPAVVIIVIIIAGITSVPLSNAYNQLMGLFLLCTIMLEGQGRQ